eukprot:scaffold129863_cov41-Tisochrysis_lutea.AAC.1
MAGHEAPPPLNPYRDVQKEPPTLHPHPRDMPHGVCRAQGKTALTANPDAWEWQLSPLPTGVN